MTPCNLAPAQHTLGWARDLGEPNPNMDIHALAGHKKP